MPTKKFPGKGWTVLKGSPFSEHASNHVEVYKALGAVIIIHSQWERAIDGFKRALESTIGPVDFSNSFNKIDIKISDFRKEVVKHSTKDEVSRIDFILNEFRKFSCFRNRIAHGYVFTIEENNYSIEIIDPTKKYRDVKYTANDIMNIVDIMNDFLGEFSFICMNAWGVAGRKMP